MRSRALPAQTRDLPGDLANEVIARNPLQASFLLASMQAMSPARATKLAGYIDYCLSSGLTMEQLAEAYNTITTDIMVEQMYFRMHKTYRYSRFSEVAEKVYFDAGYMKKYMYGLALTAFLWPSHAAIHDFFVRSFPTGSIGDYLEIGPGHGYYFMEAAGLGHFDALVGVDISTASIGLTRDIVAHFGVDRRARVELIEADFLALPPPVAPYSCIVMGEVLEHVEEPERFLRAIASMSSPQTHIYVTTCVNAPAVDHIYLFTHPAEIEAMVLRCGFSVKEQHVAPYANLTFEQSMARRLPVNVAYVLQKT